MVGGAVRGHHGGKNPMAPEHDFFFFFQTECKKKSMGQLIVHVGDTVLMTAYVLCPYVCSPHMSGPHIQCALHIQTVHGPPLHVPPYPRPLYVTYLTAPTMLPAHADVPPMPSTHIDMPPTLSAITHHNGERSTFQRAHNLLL